MSRSDGYRLAGTALVCFGLLVYEILSSRLLGVLLEGYVFIFAIAFAMLGMGAATSLMSLSVWPEPGSDRNRSLSWPASALGLSYLISLFLLTSINGHANEVLENAMVTGGLDGLVEAIRGNWLYKLVWVGAILFIPYFVFGIFIAILFRSSAQVQYHKLYSADLIGASIGCILAVVSLDHFGYAGCLGLILVSTFMGAAAFSEMRSKFALILNAGLAVSVVPVLMNSSTAVLFEPQPVLNQLARNYDEAYEVTQEWHVWNALSRVAKLTMRHRESGATKSVYAHQEGSGWATVPDESPYPPARLVTMFDPERVLVLFAGVGRDMVKIDEQCGGRCEITGVEINRQMVNHALSEGYPELNGFLSRPGIELHLAEGREFLERDTKRYDAILLSWWGAGASHYVGMSGMLAEYLYTKEAFESLLDHLSPDGLLVVLNGSKAQTLANFRKIFEERNLGDLSGRVVVVKAKDQPPPPSGTGFYDTLEGMRLVMKPSGFTEREMSVVKATAEDIEVDVILSPEGVDPDYAVYQEIASGGDIEAINRELVRKNNVELWTVTDDRPFFTWLLPQSFYLDFDKWLDFDGDSMQWRITKTLFYFIMLLCGAAVLLIIGPLLSKSGPDFSAQNITKLFYFLSLGAGFILIEVGLVRKLGLILGHPSYSISIVLAALIFSTGIGSLNSRWAFRSGILTVRRTASMIVLYVVLGAVLYEPVLYKIIVLPIAIKAAVVMIWLFPLGFLMGQLFPEGLVRAAREDARLVPWAWAINGTASTMFVGVGYFLCYPLGFNMLLYIGAAVYAVLIFLPLKDTARRPVMESVKALT